MAQENKVLKRSTEVSSVSKSGKKGFTLIELLVVISIIALLLSILMPALAKVKEQAKTLVCRSNIRQLSVALETYTADHNHKAISTSSKLPDNTYDPHMWFLVIAPYLGDNHYYDDPTSALEGSMKTLWCPSTREPRVPSPNPDFGNNGHRWRFQNPGLEGEGSYGINTWVGGIDIDSQLFWGYINSDQATNCSLRDMSARSNTPVFADSFWMEVIPMDRDQSQSTLFQNIPPYINDPDYIGGDYSMDDYGMRRYCIDRHSMAINIAFADGHAEKIKLEKLWSLKWNRSFKTTNKVDLN